MLLVGTGPLPTLCCCAGTATVATGALQSGILFKVMRQTPHQQAPRSGAAACFNRWCLIAMLKILLLKIAQRCANPLPRPLQNTLENRPKKTLFQALHFLPPTTLTNTIHATPSIFSQYPVCSQTGAALQVAVSRPTGRYPGAHETSQRPPSCTWHGRNTYPGPREGHGQKPEEKRGWMQNAHHQNTGTSALKEGGTRNSEGLGVDGRGGGAVAA